MFKLTDQTIQQRVDEYFRLFDKNNDGFLDETESVLFLDKFCQSVGRNINADTLDEVRNRIDTNRNGLISKQELTVALRNEEDYVAKRNLENNVSGPGYDGRLNGQGSNNWSNQIQQPQQCMPRNPDANANPTQFEGSYQQPKTQMCMPPTNIRPLIKTDPVYNQSNNNYTGNYREGIQQPQNCYRVPNQPDSNENSYKTGGNYYDSNNRVINNNSNGQGNYYPNPNNGWNGNSNGQDNIYR